MFYFRPVILRSHANSMLHHAVSAIKISKTLQCCRLLPVQPKNVDCLCEFLIPGFVNCQSLPERGWALTENMQYDDEINK